MVGVLSVVAVGVILLVAVVILKHRSEPTKGVEAPGIKNGVITFNMTFEGSTTGARNPTIDNPTYQALEPNGGSAHQQSYQSGTEGYIVPSKRSGHEDSVNYVVPYSTPDEVKNMYSFVSDGDHGASAQYASPQNETLYMDVHSSSTDPMDASAEYGFASYCEPNIPLYTEASGRSAETDQVYDEVSPGNVGQNAMPVNCSMYDAAAAADANYSGAASTALYDPGMTRRERERTLHEASITHHRPWYCMMRPHGELLQAMCAALMAIKYPLVSAMRHRCTHKRVRRRMTGLSTMCQREERIQPMTQRHSLGTTGDCTTTLQ